MPSSHSSALARRTLTRRRSPRALAAMVMLVAGAGGVGLTRNVAGAAGCSAAAPKGWSTAVEPVFPSSSTKHFGGEGTLIAVDPSMPTRMFASNGLAVMRSVDGGCTWTSAWAPDPSSPSTTPENDYAALTMNYNITAIEVGDVGSTAYVYATLSGNGPDEPDLVAISRDSGTTWTVVFPSPGGDATAVSTGSYSPQLTFAVAPSDGKTMYLATNFATGPAAVLAQTAKGMYVTTDGGGSWKSVAAAGLPAGWFSDASTEGDNFNRRAAAELDVDPLNSRIVWATWNHTPFAAYKSVNGGASFLPVTSGATVTQTPFDPPYFGAFVGRKGLCDIVRSNVTAYTSLDGKKWKAVPPPPGSGSYEGATCLSGGRVLALVGTKPSTGGLPPFGKTGLYYYVPGKKWVSLGAPPVASSQIGFASLTVAGPASHPVVFLQAQNADPAKVGQYLLVRYTNPLLTS